MRFTVCLAALLGLACAAPPGGETVLAGSAARTLLILPLNVTAVMPPELETPAPVVWKELELYLRDRDKQLKTVAFRTARNMWLRSIRQARAVDAQAGFDEAARLLVLELARHAEFDNVILPSLYIQKAEISGRNASWDGATRPVEIEADTLETRSLAADTPLEGVAPAASLHAVVLDARGDKIQEGRGALELLVRVRVLGRRESPASGGGFELVSRADIFGDRARVRAGIAEALAPFVTPPREPD